MFSSFLILHSLLSTCGRLRWQLIKRDELNVNCESEVYDAVLAWVKYEERNRRPKLEQLLAGVRCVFLTPNFLRKQIQQCEILKSNQGCRDYLSRIFKVKLCNY